MLSKLKRYDLTIYAGESHLELWDTDDRSSDAWVWSHSLYVSGRDLPMGSPYLLTLEQVMEALKGTFGDPSVTEAELLWLNAEQFALKWTVEEWQWFHILIREGARRLKITGPFEYFNTYDMQYGYIAKIVQPNYALVPLYPGRWYDLNLRQLQESKYEKKIALIGPTITAQASLMRIMDDIQRIPGCHTGIWAGPDLLDGEYEHINKMVARINERLDTTTGSTPSV